MTREMFDDNYTAMLDYIWELTDDESRFLAYREYMKGFIEASRLSRVISNSTAEWLSLTLDEIPYKKEEV